MTSYKQHLRSFFAFYANFDFKRNLICPYLAKTISKSGSRNLGSLKDLDKYNSCRLVWTISIKRFYFKSIDTLTVLKRSGP